MTQPKKVLIVCYYWPPAGGPGVQRWLKFVKYLPEFGIEPIVYVPDNPSYPITDEALLKEVPKGVTLLKRPIKEPYGVAGMLSQKHTNSISAGLVPAPKKQNALQKALLYIRGNYFIPDARVGWVKPSITYLKQVLATQGIETVITTGPPHSMHLIGLGLKKALPKVEWLADFRDPWTTIGYHSKLKMTIKTQEKHQALEKEVLQTADKIVVTSPSTKEEFAQSTTQPITVITNGYDIEENQEIHINKHFTLAHIGSLLSDRNPTILWSVISKISKVNTAFRNSLRLSLAGRVSQDVLDSIGDFDLTPYVDVKGYISHSEAIQLQRSSNVLLLIEIDAKHTQSIIPGKLFEYLAARRPILAIGPEGSDMEAIIKSTQSGSYHNYTEETRIEKVILAHFERFLNKKEALQKGNITPYHRKTLTKSLANTIVH